MRRFESMGLDKRSTNVLLWMCVLIAVNQLGFGSIVPVIALYAEEFGVNKTAIGLTIAIYGLARFLINLPAGRLCDVIGRRGTLAIGGIVTVIGASLCAIAPNYEIFLAARFIAGAGAAAVLTAGQIVLADIASPQNRGRVMATYQGVFLFSVGIGALPGGWMASHIGLASPFWGNAILAGIVTLIAWFQVPETRGFRSHGSSARSAPTLTMREQVRLILNVPGFGMICLVSFAGFFARTGALFNVVPLIAKDRINLSPDQIGLGLGMISVMSLILVYPSGAMVDRFGRKAVIVPSTILTGGALLLFGSAGSFAAYMVASLVWSAASGISGAAPAAYAADIAPSGYTAPTMGLYRALADAGYVIGPLGLGMMSDLASPVISLVFTAAVLVISGLLFAFSAPESIPSRAIRTTPPHPAP